MTQPEPAPYGRTLSEMAADAANGHGSGVACPKCGCRDLLAYKTESAGSRTIRYRRCRHCGQKVLTSQRPAPEEIIRDVGGDERAQLRILRAG